MSATARVPAKVSPAPVVSTAVTWGAGTTIGSAPRAAYRLPAAPRVTTTSGTSSSRASAAAPGSVRPVRVVASCSLGSNRSVALRSSRGSGWAGAGVRTVRTPWARAASAPARTAASGISSWSSRASAEAMRPSSPGARWSTVPLAAGITTIALPPSSSTTMWAVPEEPSVVRRWSVSTPECSRVERSRVPKESLPTAPIMETVAPARAAATAWLAPLPPGIVRNSRPVTVSPCWGAFATKATRSMLVLPSTAMCVMGGAPPGG